MFNYTQLKFFVFNTKYIPRDLDNHTVHVTITHYTLTITQIPAKCIGN